MGRSVGFALSAAVASSLALPSAAAATLPKFPSKKIVPGKSIGGVGPGMSLAAAQTAWGPGGVSEADDACQEQGRTSCIWKGRSSRERAILRLDGNGKVAGVLIVGGPTSPLARLRTSSGLGLGTKSSVFLEKYGNFGLPVGLGAPSGSGVAYVLKKTTYYGSRTSKRIIGVQI